MYRPVSEDQFDFTSHCEACVEAKKNGDKFCVYHWGYVGGYGEGYSEGYAEGGGS